jgi:hypothetical protein
MNVASPTPSPPSRLRFPRNGPNKIYAISGVCIEASALEKHSIDRRHEPVRLLLSVSSKSDRGSPVALNAAGVARYPAWGGISWRTTGRGVRHLGSSCGPHFVRPLPGPALPWSLRSHVRSGSLFGPSSRRPLLPWISSLQRALGPTLRWPTGDLEARVPSTRLGARNLSLLLVWSEGYAMLFIALGLAVTLVAADLLDLSHRRADRRNPPH